jgi:glycosyltransferase involved in cell wall biosynthesis
VETVNLIDIRHPQILRAKASLDQGIIPTDFSALVDQIQNELRRLFQGPQVVIAHNVASLNKNLALTAALHNLSQENQPAQLILWHHDLAWKTERYQSELHDGWPWDLLRTAWPGVKQVTVSEVRRQELAGLIDIPMRQISVVPAGLDLVDFLGLPPHLARLADDIHLTLTAPILLSPVRLNRRKNLELALETLAELRQRMPQAALIVTGPPTLQGKAYLESLKKLRRELGLEGAAFFLAERFPDGLSEAGLLGFYRLADALLITSREEGFGVPLLEAGLAGIPIFCSRLESLQALAGENAAYFDLQDPPKQIASLIASRLLSDPVYRMRVRVRNNFTWEGIYRKHLLPLLEL